MRQLLALAREHLGLAVAGTVVLASLVRIMVVSYGNSQTALALLQERGAVDVVSGTVLGSLVTLIPIAALYVTMLALPSMRSPWPAVTVLGLSMLWMAFFVSLPMAVVLLVLGPPSFLLGRYVGRRRRNSARGRLKTSEEELRALVRRSMVVVGGLFAFTLLVLSPPWLPVERLVVDGEEFSGYVLRDDGNRVSILRESDRSLSYEDSDVLTERELCTPRSNRPLGSSLLDLIRTGPDYPDCPD